MIFLDAHNHLHDVRLAPHRAEIIATIEEAQWRAVVVNGTREQDWAAVAALAQERSWVRPAFGLHPWHVQKRSDHWREQLLDWLDAFPSASIGEVGLDRWIEGHDIAQQTEILQSQMAIAVERDLPVTIHCLRAWGALWELLSGIPLPPRGFLLHAYGGPAEMIQGFEKLGAHFSFSSYFLHERKARQREAFSQISMERLLVETDAPDMAPPEVAGARFLREQGTEHKLNTPLNLRLAYEALAQIRGMEVEEMAGQINETFERLFGTGA